MKRIIKTTVFAGVLISGTLGATYYAFKSIDFIGQKDPKIMEEKISQGHNILLFAEYRNGTDYCTIDLLDSVNIKINVGNKSGGVVLNEAYQISNDTIVLTGGIKHAGEYLNSDKFLIRSRALLFKIDSHGNFDTTATLTIKYPEYKN